MSRDGEGPKGMVGLMWRRAGEGGGREGEGLETRKRSMGAFAQSVLPSAPCLPPPRSLAPPAPPSLARPSLPPSAPASPTDQRLPRCWATSTVARPKMRPRTAPEGAERRHQQGRGGRRRAREWMEGDAGRPTPGGSHSWLASDVRACIWTGRGPHRPPASSRAARETFAPKGHGNTCATQMAMMMPLPAPAAAVCGAGNNTQRPIGTAHCCWRPRRRLLLAPAKHGRRRHWAARAPPNAAMQRPRPPWVALRRAAGEERV